MDQLAIEKKWQKKWKDEAIFAPKPSNKEKFFATVPYPYANSALHIGHGRTNTAADIIARFQRLKGKNVLFPMAFHISGTPVLAVADGIKRNDPKQIKLTSEAIAEYETDDRKKKELLDSFVDPMNIASYFSSKIEETFDTIGLSIDWTRQFTTGDDIYKKFIQWQYYKLKEAGILVQGKYPILYSAQDSNAVGEDDIKDGDTDKVSIQEMKYIKFKLTDSDEYLVAATLRPDSLFGATNLYVKPGMKLAKIKVGNDIWIVSSASVSKIEHQLDNVSKISEHTGDEFIGKKVVVPLLQKQVPIHPMDYPDENHGTGIVYSSPADSPHDYIYLFELTFPGKSLSEFDEDPLKLTPITSTKNKKGEVIQYKSNIPAFDMLYKKKIFNVKGNEEKLEEAKEELYKEAHYGATMINCGGFDGTPLKGNVGATKVSEELQKQQLGGIFLETSRRAQTRAGDDVIVANLDGQWFLDYSSKDVKQKAYDVLDNMTFYPKHLRDTQKGYLTWVQKRPCARKRGLGTPLPFDEEWIIEPLSDSTIYQMFYLIANYIHTNNISAESLTKEVFDFVFLGIGDEKNKPVSSDILLKMREEVVYWKSFDLRYTAPTHMSNHLSFLIYHYGLIFEKEYWPNNITVAGLLIKDGQKISKSKGNGIPLIRVRELYGADIYRLYVGVAATFDAEMDFRDEDIQQLAKKFNKWKELMFSVKEKRKKSYNNLTNLQKWLVSRFYSRAKDYFAAMEEIRFRDGYVSMLYEFLGEISHLERRTNTQEMLDALRFIFEDYVKIMAPTTPHVCEELYGDEFVSLAEFTTDCDKYISSDVEDIETMVQELATSISRRLESQPETKTVTLYQATEKKYELFNAIKLALEKSREFKDIVPPLMKDFAEEKKFIQKFVPKTLRDGLNHYLSKEEEKQFLQDIIPFLQTACNFESIILSEEESDSAHPGKVSIRIE